LRKTTIEKLDIISIISNALLVVCFVAFLMLPQLIGVAVAGNDDSNLKEVGVEWVENYYGPNLQWTKEEAEGFYNRLGEIDWTKRFNWGDDWAWESDFEKAAVGGYDYIYIDTVDFAYFAGHGGPTVFQFGIAHDGGDGQWERYVHYSEAEWGDLDLEWIAIHACQILLYDYDPNVFDRWGWPVFKGLHAIFSFDSLTYDMPIWIWWPFWWESPGVRFVNYMIKPYTIGYAWERTTIDWQPSDVWAAALAVWDPSTGYVQWNDYLPGYGSMGPDHDSPSGLAWRRWQC